MSSVNPQEDDSDAAVPHQSQEQDSRTFGQRRRDAEALAADLPPRQREVLAHLLRGLAPKEIAQVMDLKLNTINEYIKSLHRHFNVNSRAELLAMFVPTWY